MLAKYFFHYNTDDDGVWMLHDTCGWDGLLGFDATVDDAVRVAVAHEMECSSDS